MGTALTEQLKWIEKNEATVPTEMAESTIGMPYTQVLGLYKEQLEKLPSIITNYASIDTYARWMNTTRSWRKLDELKATLMLFFTLEQFHKGFDPRYESFIGAVLNHGKQSLPDDLVTLTWNYDQHMALALARSKPQRNLNTVMSDHQISTLYAVGKGQVPNFRMLHLNGIAGVYSRMADHALLDDLEASTMNANLWMEWLHMFGILFMDRSSDGLVSLFNYSWDSTDDTKMKWESVESRLADVEQLIAVGYSFPDFNRSVDLRLIRAMKKLKRIVIQTTPGSMDGLMAKLHLVLPELQDRIVPYPIVHEFFIPNELLGASA
ncbi:MAG: hypothetical protein KF797_09045 [Flavobacteriales bacterium]|nr:hypothetical protein [Flavobacteriales bacterium]